MSSNYTNFSLSPISSLINQNQHFELSEKQALIKALRCATGEFKTQADSSNITTTLAVEPEFSFNVSNGGIYIVQADLVTLVGGATGPLGGLKAQLNLPNHGASNYTSSGIITTTVHATAPTIIGLGSATNTPVAGDVQGYNTPLTLVAAGTANAFAQVSIQALLIPQVDDVLTLSFAQVSAAVSNPTYILRGSSMQVLAVAGSRRAPNVV